MCTCVVRNTGDTKKTRPTDVEDVTSRTDSLVDSS